MWTLAQITKSGVHMVDIGSTPTGLDDNIELILTPPTAYVAIIVYYNGRKIKKVTYQDILEQKADEEAYRRFRDEEHG